MSPIASETSLSVRITAFALRASASQSPPVPFSILIETGRLSPDARVFGSDGILGTRFGRQPYSRFVEDLTVDHLLTHTCGGWPNDGSDPMFRDPAASHEALISGTLNTLPLTNPPGQAYAYSNFGFCLLGRVIESVTGRTYEEHVRTRILDRCAVRGLSIAGNTLSERQPSEVRYYGQLGENPYRMNVQRMDSHGGWLGTARDLATFATHVDGFTTTPDILQARTVRTMTTPSGVNQNYARGWTVNRLSNWWHGGSLPGTTAILVRTASGFCWAALANSSSGVRQTSLSRWTSSFGNGAAVSAWRE